ncbi:septal ring lytic transglycosylase RlpA family protein [Marinomonas mediterranea]|jgi:rare lipoprotein A|uniref:Endolytic peptidoglycan transglycosylase RlpA n=1 Tax=Marinomonas mediterranea (strain ATCC 700492 / JCM 21426 / NBRC 103028 / MMB-1) TaxID=717774 RepID=F2JY09_MARM1|nr:septal ring lytic transglycosylase RlpA family protein [Marinomonas mediterranea]ADZ90745.1 rare lipoprotein A [Marinomonas mediterranea MMB-1]WCN08787.1 septal ring lytic transglycosylase RlpA family protein [Marinomonas mediterranea]WCN12833.1 septal ring lytic transglycosylase RlpA family protein [Marinomonas mediterranea]WCN16900.1 septal ring lytic transglycosylase RlpA family protein [Marinomonas mediterranea MMB-1]
MNCNRLLILIVIGLSLNGCMSTKHINGGGSSSADLDKATGGGRYTILQDHGPSSDVKVDHLPDLVPKWEPKSRGGNKSPYVVWGKQYYVMSSAEGYSAQGTASWYGKKFHGHKTSNGETYDMYAFSAAHKSLPLPTYLKVTNIDNGRSVIVRVNDRGPFHGDRLIDLSYAAAVRLDYHKKGLARVKVEAITPKPGQTLTVKTNSNAVAKTPVVVPKAPQPSSVKVTSSFTHLQLGAFSSQDSAESLKNKLIEQFDTQIIVQVISSDSGLYKVLVGPYNSPAMLAEWQTKLEDAGFAKSVKVALSQ